MVHEHYWGYARQLDGGAVEYRVDAERLYGAGFASPCEVRPRLLSWQMGRQLPFTLGVLGLTGVADIGYSSWAAPPLVVTTG